MAQPKLIGICHVWIENVRLTGYGAVPNEYMPPGTVGDMEVVEVSRDGRVLQALFHPGGRGHGHGYGLVMWPHWEHVLPAGAQSCVTDSQRQRGGIVPATEDPMVKAKERDAMTYRQWKETDDQLKQKYATASTLSDAAYEQRRTHQSKMCLQVSLPSGTRTTISDLDGERLVITAANEHGFLTLGMLSAADLRVFLEIRETLDAWKRGELDDFPWPAIRRKTPEVFAALARISRALYRAPALVRR